MVKGGNTVDGFYGRSPELEELRDLYHKKVASLVVVNGRRRIGKSRLIEEFAKAETFYSFSGLVPTESTTVQSQLDEFARQLSQQTGLPEVTVNDWSKLFLLLAEKAKQGRVIILFDEISWMGSKDPDFLGKLKNAWDLSFKKNPKLILILCGSVSAWIEKNIIASTGFLGRPSLYIRLGELTLSECNQFWGKRGEHIAAHEKFKLLSVTGGVPRYLELIDPKVSAEENIKKLCFTKSSPLAKEFENIFTDIFSKRHLTYRNIVEQLVKGPLNANDIAKNSGQTRTGTFDGYLNDLVLSGFIARDFTWDLGSEKISKLSRFRLKDNYVRFYLKYIMPNQAKIEKDQFRESSLTVFPGWDTIMGLQFENLVLNNYKAIIKSLNILPQDIVFDNPYFQRATTRTAGCQIDYLIQTRFDTVYICEIKFSRSPIKIEIVQELQKKLEALKTPKHISRRSVLIHVNGVSDSVIESQFFSNIIDFSQFLNQTT